MCFSIYISICDTILMTTAILTNEKGHVEEAARMGLPVAMGILAERYYFGEGNCPVDPALSTQWAVKVSIYLSIYI
jgi:hypothetical protein